MKAFIDSIQKPLSKDTISVLQFNLGKKCNLACHHCHVDAGPSRTEEISDDVLADLLILVQRFPQVDTIDLTGGAPEMCNGFRQLVVKAHESAKRVIVRSNLTIFFEPGYDDLPSFFAENRVRVVASLPCYLEFNVDTQRGQGVFRQSIEAIKLLNAFGYGEELVLDLVYNPQLPKEESDFMLSPDQNALEYDYKEYLGEQFGISFNNLLTITNLPIGRTKQYLKRKKLLAPYIDFLSDHFNPATVPQLMCRNELSIDYLGRVFDCDFNQMENLGARGNNGDLLSIKDLLKIDSLDVIEQVRLASHCYGCTAGAGASCGGAICTTEDAGVVTTKAEV